MNNGCDSGLFLSYLTRLETFRIYSSTLSLSLSLDLMEALVSDTHNKGIKCTITGYNHIDSVDECSPAISIGYVFLQLRYMIVGGKLVPLGGGNPVE